LLPFLSGCGDKFDVSELTSTGGSSANITGDTVYVQLNPEWKGFNNPQDILIGREPFIYVADTENDRVVMLNLNGDILGSRHIRRPVALGQDYKLNLIVCAQLDTVVNGQTNSFGAVYKLDLVAAQHQIAAAPMIKLLPRPVDLNYPQRKYTGVAVFYNNTFYVARTGPNNSSFIDPDNSILYFSPKKLFAGGEGDTLIGRIPNIDPLSSGLVSANQISSLTSFNRRNIDFIETLTGNNALKTQWLTYVITPVSADYEARLTPSDGGALMTPNKFIRPEGTCIDDAGNIYVADAAKDSIFKFTPLGDELQSFGGTSVFNGPYAVAYFDNILYVADTGNNRILRFMLSTDLR
jgi:DNA-binding beta-propeller fold protein YncE